MDSRKRQCRYYHASTRVRVVHHRIDERNYCVPRSSRVVLRGSLIVIDLVR